MGLESLLDLLVKAEEHHDVSKPAVSHDLPALTARTSGTVLRDAVVGLLSDPRVVAALLPLVLELLDRKKAPAETVHNPPTIFPVDPRPLKPAPITEPEPPAAPAPAPATSGKLEAWLEQGWHDWKKGPGDENPDGLFDPAAELAARPNVALPPAPVLRFMTGIAVPGGNALVPRNDPGVAFPVVTHHFDLSGQKFSFTSAADPGVKQPVKDLGHVQGGDIFQLSDGWDFILRVNGFHGDGPRVLTYHTEAPGFERSNDVVVPIARSRD